MYYIAAQKRCDALHYHPGGGTHDRAFRCPRHPTTVDLDQYRETMRWIEQSQIPGTPEWCDNEEMSANEPETITREIRASLTCSIAAMSPEAEAAVDAQLETYGRPDVVLSADDCIELMLVHGCVARDQQTPKQASAYK